jgi:hypothetical protein
MLLKLSFLLYSLVAVCIVVFLEVQSGRERERQRLSHYSRTAWGDTRLAYLLAFTWPLVLIVALVGGLVTLVSRRRQG